ncbi:NAD+ synthetase [Synechococcus sp. PCC 7502]|uniref:NAD+ synthase n=1 Tax=Synechococcus sp. PCC 7502 TaxID=1173263 RepID=UPI00029FFAEA|nr:NAD+ synthase [Synechococcus sp. PCC 7502]AFY75206.1 NAD+ synthetase [Synechococcus sp. PCC 7502]
MKIAIAQLNPTIGDLAENSRQILRTANQCFEQNVSLLITPELSLCGYPPRDLLIHDGFIQELAIALQLLAETLPASVAVLVGTVEVNPHAPITGSKPLFNSAALLHHGKIQQVFHKRLLPTYDVFDEDRYFAPGDRSNSFILNQSLDQTPNQTLEQPLRIGVTICEDIWNDYKFWGKRFYADDPVADLAAQSVDLLVNLSASPYAIGKPQLRESMLSHSAIAHNLPVIYANQVGANDELIFDGHSAALNQKGEVIARGLGFKSDLLIIDYEAQDLHSLIAPKPEPFDQFDHSTESEIWNALVLGVRDYAHKCGFKQAVLGLSGGVDSALVGAIATAALGRENVLGILMPSPYSSDHSISDALELAKNLQISTQIIPIAPMMSAFDQALTEIFRGKDQDITEENLQSRIRGNILMAVSNKFGHLLLSTGNKSEMSVGYCTLYGDMNGGLAVIGDVLKTRVYKLCAWLNQNQELIPQHILTKPPSAELKLDQVDQDSLPAYEILDDILEKLISDRLAPKQIIKTGHDPQTVKRVVNLVNRAEFKRRQAAPVLKISDRAFGSGWRMPIAAKTTVLSVNLAVDLSLEESP